MPLYLPELTAAAWQASIGDTVAFSGTEARHAAIVRRLGPGEAITLADGAGLALDGEIVTADRDRVTVRVAGRRRARAPRPGLVLVQALGKGGRDELAVQSCTEAGVDAIVPWQASRCVSVWRDHKRETGRQRWASIAREASKQSLRPRVPAVCPLHTTVGLVDAVTGRGRLALALVLDPEAQASLAELPLPADVDEIAVIVGPEGGIAPDELARLRAAGARGVRLGPTVLRTSSAGLAAIAVLSARLGRWTRRDAAGRGGRAE